MMTGGHPQLLSGVRVIDLSQNLSGPYGSMLLADMGADVIKVEPLTGDPQRTLIPFVDGVSLLFTAVNRNKRGVAINLKDPERQAVAAAPDQPVQRRLQQLPSRCNEPSRALFRRIEAGEPTHCGVITERLRADWPEGAMASL